MRKPGESYSEVILRIARRDGVRQAERVRVGPWRRRARGGWRWAVVDEAMTEINVRIATADDTIGVLAVLTEVAAEIPLRLDTYQQQEAAHGIVTQGISFGESLVALDNNGNVVGFLLIEPDKLERFYHDNQALHLRYGGVAKSHRRAGIFRALLQQAMDRRVLLTATGWLMNRGQFTHSMARSHDNRTFSSTVCSEARHIQRDLSY